MRFPENTYANFGREARLVDLEGEASLMTGGSTTALSLLSPLTCTRMCDVASTREGVARTKVKADSHPLL